VDFSLVRNFKPTETVSTQFRVDAFNALNHTNLGLPGTSLFDAQGRTPAAAGRITSTSTDSRKIQMGIKLSF
jgi:hypothetical protein